MSWLVFIPNLSYVIHNGSRSIPTPSLTYIHNMDCNAQGGRVQVFIPLGNPFIHFNVLCQTILLDHFGTSFLPTQTQRTPN